MDRFELQKLRDLPIEEVAERLGLQVVRHKCLCPFHDDHHASLSFNLRRNTFRCFVCGASGDNIALVMRFLSFNFQTACRWLANENNVIMAEYHPKEIVAPKPFDGEKFKRYFEHPFLNELATNFLYHERHLDPRVVRWCRLTSWKEWLQIPYYDTANRLTGVQWRYLGTDRTKPRFRFPRGSQCGIYNLPILNMLHQGEELWITEGCSDCWAMLSSGHKAIAIPSATLLTPKDIVQLTDINARLSVTFHMYPDHDAPGERLFLQLKQVLPDIVHHQLPQGCKDYAEAFLRHSTCGGMPD